MPWAQHSRYFTEKFWKDHVYEGSENQAKRDAEEIYLRRDVTVSSVLEMDPHEIRVLISEITKRQAEYATNPRKEQTSTLRLTYWEREGKRARRIGPAKFKYKVKNEHGMYKIHHFGGVV